ncbi:uncharacterized protein METZ01_LOCUS461996 [marine metagenome]|uniref:Uncharacterized protein n=1 Tax=marine metagenome TaxID=408172 RepID=A0A383AN36_9ZZZZ
MKENDLSDLFEMMIRSFWMRFKITQNAET